MNKIITGACIIVVCCYSSCANKDESDNSDLTNTDSSRQVTITPGSQNFAKPDTILPGNRRAMITPLPQALVNQASLTTTAIGMNPAHGQLNHRCDIAVGAPLNSPLTKPGTQTGSSVATPPVPTIAAPALKTTAKTVTLAGMNPQHGEPGHRCDISVGAPLNSPVTKPGTNTVSATPTPALQSTVTPAQKTITLAGMNPQHGEPGHRCDISVGAPLNSPVTKPATQTVKPTLAPAPVIVPPKKDSGS